MCYCATSVVDMMSRSKSDSKSRLGLVRQVVYDLFSPGAVDSLKHQSEDADNRRLVSQIESTISATDVIHLPRPFRPMTPTLKAKSQRRPVPRHFR